MKRRAIHSIPVAVFVLCSGFAFSADQPAPKKVACVGDSITYGMTIKDRVKDCYPAQLALALGEKWSVQNFGVNKATLLKKGDYPYWSFEQYKAALEFQPDLVIIMLGTNDSKPENWKNKDKFVPNYIELIDSFQQLESQPTVWICYPVPAYPGRWGITDKVIKEEVMPLIDEAAVKTNVKVIDLHEALSGQQEMFPDAVHPNPAGAKMIAETISAIITGNEPQRAEEENTPDNK
ncbi:hypothetical protein JXA32_03780 [Candidatus Sumerlaeota bacterium]|nr:hypothetical protein [Candidatus Sumerlaeota bacterium]